MSRVAESKQWLTLAEAAVVARRSERTLRNWVRDGVLRAPTRGLLNRGEVLVAERTMRMKRGRPAPSGPRILQVAEGSWVSVVPCGSHVEALRSGMIALNCTRCRREPVPYPGPS